VAGGGEQRTGGNRWFFARHLREEIIRIERSALAPLRDPGPSIHRNAWGLPVAPRQGGSASRTGGAPSLATGPEKRGGLAHLGAAAPREPADPGTANAYEACRGTSGVNASPTTRLRLRRPCVPTRPPPIAPAFLAWAASPSTRCCLARPYVHMRQTATGNPPRCSGKPGRSGETGRSFRGDPVA
jgi:hypothetical protein